MCRNTKAIAQIENDAEISNMQIAYCRGTVVPLQKLFINLQRRKLGFQQGYRRAHKD
jgi:DNA mismatch repair ATPase MutL